MRQVTQVTQVLRLDEQSTATAGTSIQGLRAILKVSAFFNDTTTESLLEQDPRGELLLSCCRVQDRGKLMTRSRSKGVCVAKTERYGSIALRTAVGLEADVDKLGQSTTKTQVAMQL